MLNKRKGFTLIELIIVMSIIFIMLSLTFPRFKGYMNRAKNLKAIDTGRQIYMAVLESYTEGDEDFNKDKIIENTKELLGINDIHVDENNEGQVDIKYKVDNKNYNLKINDTNGFTIKDDEDKLLYPKCKNSSEKR